MGSLSLRRRFLLVLLPVVVAGPLLVGVAAEWSAGRDRQAFRAAELEAELQEATLPLETRLAHLAVSADAFALHFDQERADDADGLEPLGVADEHWTSQARLLLGQWPEVIEVYRLSDRKAGRLYSQVRRDWSRDQVLRPGSGPAWVWEVERDAPALPADFSWSSVQGREWMWWSRKLADSRPSGASASRLGILVDPRQLPLDATRLDSAESQWLALLSPSGQLLASSTTEAIRDADDGRTALDQLDWSKASSFESSDEWFLSHRRSERAGFVTVLAMDRRQSQGGFWRNSILMTVVMLLAALLSSLVIGHLVGRVSEPLDRLGDALQRVASGDLRPRLELRGTDEMVHLARSFNSMVTDLHTTHEAMTLQRQALSQALREAESVERMKDDFLALVSHEVRTPLTTILGGIEFLLESFKERGAETEVEFMTMVQSSAKRLGEFMNDAILMANLQAKGGEENFEEFSLHAMLDMEVDRIRPQIAELELDFDDPIRKRHELFVDGDWTLFQVAVQKLLDNACRHNRSQGKLRIDVVDHIVEDQTPLADLMASLGLRKREPAHQWQALRVMNSGSCLSEDEIPALFRRFELNHDIDHHQRGSGLSLPIVASIVSYHGGSVQARAVEGEGMAFYLVLSCRSSGCLRLAPTGEEEQGIDDVVRMARQLAAIGPEERVSK